MCNRVKPVCLFYLGFIDFHLNLQKKGLFKNLKFSFLKYYLFAKSLKILFQVFIISSEYMIHALILSLQFVTSLIQAVVISGKQLLYKL
jgi:hypothetical protein